MERTTAAGPEYHRYMRRNVSLYPWEYVIGIRYTSCRHGNVLGRCHSGSDPPENPNRAGSDMLAISIRGINGAMGFPLSTSRSDLWCIHADLTLIYIDYESANSISIQSYESDLTNPCYNSILPLLGWWSFMWNKPHSYNNCRSLRPW